MPFFPQKKKKKKKNKRSIANGKSLREKGETCPVDFSLLSMGHKDRNAAI